jgi:hypothetical protein
VSDGGSGVAGSAVAGSGHACEHARESHVLPQSRRYLAARAPCSGSPTSLHRLPARVPLARPPQPLCTRAAPLTHPPGVVP